MEKTTFVVRSKWWTKELIKKLNPPKLKIGDVSWACNYLGWDKNDK